MPDATRASVNKPHWLSADQFTTLLRSYSGVPRCVETGETDDLDVDHIVSRALGGTNDPSNLQFLARRLNAKKGPRPDVYWSRSFYWDQIPDFAALRGAQKMLWSTILDEREWFSEPISQIARVLYTAAWLVGAGKTIGIPIAATAFNYVQRERWGSPRRADRILILTKEQAIRDQIADDLKRDLTTYKIFPEAPRVGIAENGWQFEQQAWLDDQDAVVACVQQLWEKDGSRRRKIDEILASFPLIMFDEPHYASSQVQQLVDLAERSLCFGFTGTPVDSMGSLLPRMIRLSVYGYQQAAEIDQSVKYLNSEPDQFRSFVRTLGIDEADILADGLDVVDLDTSRPGYDKNVEPQKAVLRDVLSEMRQRDQLKDLGSPPARHRVGIGNVETSLHYPVHALIVVDSVKIAKMLTEDTNKMFASQRGDYPESLGWRAEAVYAEGKPLGQKHPWLKAYKQGRVDKTCARVLFVVGMAREGVNNPWCGIVGAACSATSILEAVQRWLGRQIRAYTEEREGRLLVTTGPLDTVLVITHDAFNNQGVLERAIQFVCDMESHLEGLPGIEQLKQGLPPPKKIEQETLLPIKDKIGIAGYIGDRRLNGQSVSAEDVIERFAREGGRRAERVREWVRDLDEDPWKARSDVHLDIKLDPIPIVKREYLSSNPTEAELELFAKTREFADLLPLNAETRRVTAAWHKREAESFQLPPLRSPYDDLDKVRKDLGGQVRQHVGRHLLPEGHQPLWGLVGAAMKQILGVPEGASASNGSQWDTPQAHAILMRPEIRNNMTSWVTGRLIDKGFCPSLSALFGETGEGP